MIKKRSRLGKKKVTPLKKNSFSFRWIYLLYVGIVVIVIFVGYTAYKAFDFFQTIQVESSDTNENEEPKEEKQTAYNIILTGYGGPQHDGPYLTDTIIMAHVDTEEKRAVMISLPRDLWVQVPTESGTELYSKINSFYQMALFEENYPDIPDEYAGDKKAQNILKEAVERVTGQSVDYFFGVDFDGFVEAIDTLGGIEVTVETAFADYLYPAAGKADDTCGREPKPTQTEEERKEFNKAYEEMSEEEKKAFDERPIEELTEEEFLKIATEEPHLAYPCRYEDLVFEAGTQTMDGETALKFARSRKSLQDGGDFNRARRQQLVVEAVKDKVLSVEFIPRVLPLLDQLKDHFRTDIPVSKMQEFLGEAANADQYTIENFVISDQDYLQNSVSYDGQFILVPNEGIEEWDDIQEGVSNVILGISPTPTPSPNLNATGEADLSGFTE